MIKFNKIVVKIKTFFDYVMNIFSFGEPELDYKKQDQKNKF